LVVKTRDKTNYFHIFGGKDESSQRLIQGATLSGLLLDEVALMPESFVNQAIARTVSEKKAKRLFNCNPENPNHFFYQDFILKAKERNIQVLHFQLEDNPLFDEEQIEKIKQMYTGAFYDRYILGRWVKAEGLVFSNIEDCLYDDSDEEIQQVLKRQDATEWFISCDYGTLNPCVFLKVCVDYRGQCAYFDDECVYNGREHSVQKTDGDYHKDLVNFTKGDNISDVVIDPSASSFITELRNKSGFHVTPANNDVIDGIRFTQRLIVDGKIKINKRCKNLIRELGLYSWDDKKTKDAVIKEDDHGPDAMRYFAYTKLKRMRW
jgi:PBSX family phage terminase large subunit